MALVDAFLETAGVAAGIGVGLVFLVAGTAKLRDRQLLPGVVANYRLLPGVLVSPVALMLPVVELGTGIALILGLRPAAPLAAIGLLLLFALAMAINIRRGRRHIDCGCGHSALGQTLSWALVGRNLGLALLLVPALAGAADVGSAGWMVGVFAGLLLFVLTLAFNAILALPGRAAGQEGGARVGQG